MRAVYPTARFLGIVSSRDFTEPARDLVRSKDIDLFYVPKNKVVEAFEINGLKIDYPDSTSEIEKLRLASEFGGNFTTEKREAIASTLRELVGNVVVSSYVDRVRAKLSALPQEIRLVLRHEAPPLIFRSVSEVSTFLEKPIFHMGEPRTSYLYEITYSDGSEFEQITDSLENLKALHEQICQLSEHISGLSL